MNVIKIKNCKEVFFSMDKEGVYFAFYTKRENVIKLSSLIGTNCLIRWEAGSVAGCTESGECDIFISKVSVEKKEKHEDGFLIKIYYETMKIFRIFSAKEPRKILKELDVYEKNILEFV